ncbi:MAG TPA: hypothetical protein VKU01_32155 [Bryobacteraceae bacterium]|nr:hypothetical protein [Bryobacteraceae bacterium]
MGLERVPAEKRTHITQIPEGAILSLDDPGRDSGIVEVRVEHRTIGIFLQDLRDRGVLLRCEGA